MNAEVLIDNSEQPEESEQLSSPKKSFLSLAIVLSLLIGIGIGVAVITISDYNICPGTNETLLNQTFSNGYNIGVVETSNNVLSTGMLPVFNLSETGIEYLGDLNLTKVLE